MLSTYLFLTIGFLASVVVLAGDYVTGTAFWQAAPNNQERH